MNASSGWFKLARKIFGDSIEKCTEIPFSDFLKKYKVVVFVPAGNADEVTFAMASGGAGEIGGYSVCSFRSKGVGTFMGGESTNPHVGEKGRFEMVEEVRLEMICSRKDLKSVINKMLEVHPYEEPAFEIYEVMTMNRGAAALRVNLKKAVSVEDLLKRINSKIHSKVPGTGNIKVKEAVISSGEMKFPRPGRSPKKQNTIVIIKEENSSIKIKMI